MIADSLRGRMLRGCWNAMLRTDVRPGYPARAADKAGALI